jgi:DNA mismatch repair ATPase MutS
MMKDFGDPNIAYEDRIVTSIKCDGHTIVTGPNRGGKSSFLRGVLMNVKFAHAYGVAYAKKAQMSYFTWIADGLRLADTPGKKSMFEREVEFATQVLQKEKGCGLVLYDELFHSTNPPDAERASHLFCEKLWNKTNCISLLSTHVYGLAKEAPEKIQKVCLASWKDKENQYLFSYTVQKGICRVSSVDLLLEQYGWMMDGPRIQQQIKSPASDKKNERSE